MYDEKKVDKAIENLEVISKHLAKLDILSTNKSIGWSFESLLTTIELLKGAKAVAEKTKHKPKPKPQPKVKPQPKIVKGKKDFDMPVETIKEIEKED